MKWIVRVLIVATISHLPLAAVVVGFAQHQQPLRHSSTTTSASVGGLRSTNNISTGGRQRRQELIPSRTTFTTTKLLLSNKNPFSSMIGDMADSLFGGNNNDNKNQVVSSNSNVDAALNALQVSSWSTIRDELTKKQTPEERDFRTNLQYGYGTLGSPLNKIRLYNPSNKEEDIQVTFYRDSASWCKFSLGSISS